MDKLILGSLEICDLPALGIHDLQVRVDTGAKTSSLHVDNIEKFKKGGKPWIRFDLHPDVHRVKTVTKCSAKVHDIRRIKSSNGAAEQRYIIKTPITLGSNSWDIEISLTDRSDMNYLMLLGREGMGSRVLVDPSQTYLLSSDEADIGSSF